MKRRDEVLVGIFTTIAVAVGILGALWLARGGLSSGYPLHANFDWASGLKQGQPVFLAGVTIGYVDRIELDQQAGRVYVTMRVEDEYSVPAGATATVQANGLFGDMAIAVKPVQATPESYEAGDTLPSGTPQPGINEVIARLDTVTRSVTMVTDAIELQLVEGGGIADLRRTLSATSQLAAQLSRMASEQSVILAQTTSALRRSANAIDSARVDSTMQNLQETSRNLAEFTAGLEQMTQQLNTTLAQLNDTTGTAGQLINNPALYDRLTMLVTRMDSLTADIKKNPRKYINLEIF
jgi:phospholipid/cholesterol/gamma-HCH transport system substrate-binding protein